VRTSSRSCGSRLAPTSCGTQSSKACPSPSGSRLKPVSAAKRPGDVEG
jgi:hypothetical protein